MCLAIPVKIVELDGTNATIEFDGVRRPANVTLVPEVQIGDYVLMHAGFAIQKWSEQDVSEFQAIMDELKALE